MNAETPQQAARRLAAGAIRDGYQPEALHEYRDAGGAPIFWRIRCRHPDGRKWIRPMHVNGAGFELGEPTFPPTGKPLFGLDRLAAAPNAPALVVEGEACAADVNAIEAGFVAVTSGASSSADAADWTPLRGHDCVIWPDRDEPGRRYMLDVARHLRALGCRVRQVDPAIVAALPDGGDVCDWLSDHTDLEQARAALRAIVGGAVEIDGVDSVTPGNTPQPLPDPLPPVPEFDSALLPESLRRWCEDAADGLQVPLDFVAIPAIVALAGVTGRSVGLRMKARDHWVERPILWGCIVGRPSSGKSPAIAPARRMLDRLAREERELYDIGRSEFESKVLLAQGKRANAKRDIERALKDGKADAAKAAADAAKFDEEPPSEPRIVTNDATIEKVGALLNENPRGLILLRDELSGWLASMDREGHEGDRAFWLECWNGTGAYTCDRIGRGTVHVEACAVSVLGGAQPGKLGEYVRAAVHGGFGDDGLMQRFQLAVYPDLPSAWTYTDREPDHDAEREAWTTFHRLRNLDPASVGATPVPWCDVPVVGFDGEAQELFVEWLTAHMHRLRGGDEPPWIEAHLSKMPATVGRLALVLHLADGGTGAVSADTLASALNWSEYLSGHARRLYAPVADGGVGAARLVLKRRGELGERFTARDVYRRGWAGLAEPDDVQAALDVLVENGHLHAARIDTGGRPSIVYSWAVSS